MNNNNESGLNQTKNQEANQSVTISVSGNGNKVEQHQSTVQHQINIYNTTREATQQETEGSKFPNSNFKWGKYGGLASKPTQKMRLPAKDLSPFPPDQKTKGQVAENQLRIIADSYRVKKGEAFLFQVERFAKGIWTPLHPEEVHIEPAGQWYPIDAGAPSFGLKGTGNTILKITDTGKGGFTKCTVLFEN